MTLVANWLVVYWLLIYSSDVFHFPLFRMYARCDDFEHSSINSFRKAIIHLRDDVLGVSKFQDFVNNDLKLQHFSLDGAAIVQEVSSSISRKFEEKVAAVKELKNAAMDAFSQQNKWGNWKKCCTMKKNKLEKESIYDSRFSCQIFLSSMCNIEAPDATNLTMMPNHIFLTTAEKNLRLHPGLKWQYFGGDNGVLTQFPAVHAKDCNTTYDNRFRPWYVQASAPKPKDIVIVLDRSGSMATLNRMDAAQKAAITVLRTLSPDDRVSVIAFSDEAYALGTKESFQKVVSKDFVAGSLREQRNTSCFQHTMASATPVNIQWLAGEVNKIVSAGETYYGKALSLAFNFLQEAFDRDILIKRASSSFLDVARSRDRAILFLSDGEPSDAPFPIYKLIKSRNLKMYNSVVLLCYALGEGTFGAALKRIASQQFNFKFDSFADCEDSGTCNIPDPIQGVFRQVTKVEHLRSAMGSYYSFFSIHKEDKRSDASSVIWSVPYFDAFGLGMVVTAASPVVINNKLYGVVGADLAMHELLADVAYFRVAAHATYSFLIDITGRVLVHPFLPVPLNVDDDPVLTSIQAFERNPNALKFLEMILHSVATGYRPSGEPLKQNDIFTDVFTTKRILPSVHKGVLTYDALSKFSCGIVHGTKFVLCVVIEANIRSVASLAPQTPPQNFKFLYHRFDLSLPECLCQHEGQAVTTNVTSVVFAPSAFVDSKGYSEREETRETVKSYKQYMETGTYFSKESNLFKDGVRNSVLASWLLENVWKGSSNNISSFKQSGTHQVIWRYFGSEEGVFRILPGVQMPKLYDCTQRPWYELAYALMTKTFINKLSQNYLEDELAALSPPYVDANGAGLIITVSRAIREPPSNVNDSAGQPPHLFGVMGADISLDYFEELLLQNIPQCSSASSYCIVLDSSGYVLYDQPLIRQESKAVDLSISSNYHVVIAHPSVASTLLAEYILKRQRCVDVDSVSYRMNFYIDFSHLAEKRNLPFSTLHVSGTNLLILLIPNFYTSAHACKAHSSETDLCHHLEHGIQLFSDSCESPCIDPFGAQQHYAACLNMYNYTWEADPPPCVPLKFKMESESSKAINASNLPSCFKGVVQCQERRKFLLSIGAPNDQPVNFSFILYAVGCLVILIGVWVGLHKSRLCSRNTGVLNVTFSP